MPASIAYHSRRQQRQFRVAGRQLSPPAGTTSPTKPVVGTGPVAPLLAETGMVKIAFASGAENRIGRTSVVAAESSSGRRTGAGGLITGIDDVVRVIDVGSSSVTGTLGQADCGAAWLSSEIAGSGDAVGGC